MAEEKQKNRDYIKWIAIALAGFVVIIFVFGAGVFVGEMKAKFSYRWAESYHKNFAGPRSGFFGDGPISPHLFGANDFIESHGTVGEIMKVEGNNLIVKGRENIEKIILVNEKTTIKCGRKDINISDLKAGDRIVIIGSPNEKGQIEAKLIRVFPSPTGFKEMKFYE